MKIIATYLLSLICINVFSQYKFDMIEINPNGYSYAYKFTELGNLLFFCNEDSPYGDEIFVSDGTVQGTSLLKDINTSGGCDPDYLTIFQNKLYFVANDGVNGAELWVSDGTFDGTSLFMDINTVGSSAPKYLKVCGNKLFFSANDGIHGRELWVSDGSLSGTHIVKDIFPGDSASPYCLMPLANTLLFFASQSGSYDRRLWVTNGTEVGTYKIKDLWKYTNPEDFVVCQDKLYFAADDTLNGIELWVSDGTTNGTFLVKDINPVFHGEFPGSSFPQRFVVYQNKIFFMAQDDPHGQELWMSDGTQDGTYILKEINPHGHSNPLGLTIYNEKLYFSADDGVHGSELWVTDGIPDQTYMVKDINLTGSSGPYALTVNCDKLFFKATVPGTKLIVSDGTSNGTYDIQPPNTTNGSPLSFSFKFYSFQNKLFFNANFGSNLALWMLTDSTCTSTIDEVQINSFSIYPNPTYDMLNVHHVKEMTSITITNIYGELLYRWNGKSKFVTIDLNNYISGVYVVRAYSSTLGLYSKKVVKLDH